MKYSQRILLTIVLLLLFLQPFANAGTAKIHVVREPNSVSVCITAITSDGVSISQGYRSKWTTTRYLVEASTKLRLDNAPCKLADLKPGMTCEISEGASRNDCKTLSRLEASSVKCDNCPK